MIESDYYNRIVESLIQSFSLNHDVDVRFLASLINGKLVSAMEALTTCIGSFSYRFFLYIFIILLS